MSDLYGKSASEMIEILREKPYGCAICEMSFRNRVQMRLHLQVVHVRGDGKECEMCGMVCATPTEVQEHRSTHSTKDEMPQPKKRPICIIRFSTENMDPICGNAAATPVGLANHLQFNHKKSPSHIHEPDVVVPQVEIETKKEPLRALEGHQPVGVIKIQKKEPISVDPAIPEGHVQMIKYKEKAPMKCYVCGKVTIGRVGLTAHLRAHKGKTKCHICGKVISSLSVHIRRAHKKRLVTPIDDQMPVSPVMEAGTMESALEDLEQVAKLAEQLVKDSDAVAQKEIKAKDEPLEGVQEVPKPVGAKKVLKKRGIIVNSSNLGDHLRIHKKRKGEMKCHLCGKTTLSNRTLAMHVRHKHKKHSVTPTDDQRATCPSKNDETMEDAPEGGEVPELTKESTRDTGSVAQDKRLITPSNDHMPDSPAMKDETKETGLQDIPKLTVQPLHKFKIPKLSNLPKISCYVCGKVILGSFGLKSHLESHKKQLSKKNTMKQYAKNFQITLKAKKSTMQM